MGPSTSITGHYQDFQFTLSRIQRDAQQRQSVTRARFSSDVQNAQRAGCKPARDAYLEYLNVYRNFQTNPEETPVSEVIRAQFDYQEAHQKAVADTQRMCEERRQAFVDETRTIQDEVRAAWQNAFTEFVRRLHGSLAEIDPVSIDPAVLGVIGQSLVFAAMSGQSASAARS